MVEKVDRRTTDTKERIIHEALCLYKAGGAAAVKLNEITKALQVTRAALYNHFPEGKDQLFLEALAAMIHELEAAITEIMDSEPDTRERLKKLFLLSSHDSFIDLEVLFLAREELSPTVKGRMTEIVWPLLRLCSQILQEGMERGDIRTIDLPLAFLSIGMLAKQIKQVVNRNIVELPPELRSAKETDVLIEQLIDLWFVGMANSKEGSSQKQ